MCSVISDLYKMKKRRVSDAIVVSSADPNICRPKNGVAANGHQQQRNHAFLSSASSAATCPRTPRRSPRINGGFSRTSCRADSSLQESPDSQEMLITWKCNSPVYTKNLRPMHGRDLQEIVGKFVPAVNITRQPSNSLLDIWLAPCETTELPPPIKTQPVQPKSKEFQVAKEMEELIKEVDRCRSELLSDRMTNSAQPTVVEKMTSCGRAGDVWEDEDLFEDEDVIALTQQAEDIYRTRNIDANSEIDGPKAELAAPANAPLQLNKALRRDEDQDLFCDCSEAVVLDAASSRLSPNIITNLADDDSLLCCPTQVFVEETSREASVSPDVMDMGFVNPSDEPVVDDGGNSGDSDVAQISPIKETTCSQEDILRKKEAALRRRSARLRDIRTKSAITVSVCLIDRIEGNLATQERPEAQDRTVLPKEPPPMVSSQVSMCSQVRSQLEIQRNREEALKRRSVRLAAQAASKVVSISQQHQVATTEEQNRRGLCSITEIERKKREAMERRQRKLMSLKT